MDVGGKGFKLVVFHQRMGWGKREQNSNSSQCYKAWSSLVEGDEGCIGKGGGKLLCLWQIQTKWAVQTRYHSIGRCLTVGPIQLSISFDLRAPCLKPFLEENRSRCWSCSSVVSNRGKWNFGPTDSANWQLLKMLLLGNC